MSNVLYTKRLLLRDATAEDAQKLCEWKSLFLLREMSVGLRTRVTVSNQRTEIRNSQQEGNLYLIMEVRETGIPIGYIKMRWIHHAQGRCWLCYGLGSHYHQGYTYEALHRLLSALFQYSIVNRVEAEVFEFNVASQKLLEKLCFRKVGQRANEYFYKGRQWSVFMYAMTSEEALLLSTDPSLEEEEIPQSQE